MTRSVLFVFWLLAVVIFDGCSLLVDRDVLVDRARSVEIGRRPPAFGQPYTYSDGLEVRITETWVGQQRSLSVAELTVVVRNGSSHTFEAWLMGELRHGPRRQSASRCPIWPAPADQDSVQLIAMGESSHPYRLCFVVPFDSRHDTVFELRIDPGAHEPAVFAGGL